MRCFGRLSRQVNAELFWTKVRLASSRGGETVRSSEVVLTILSLCFEIQQISSAIPQSPFLFSCIKKSAAHTAVVRFFM